VVNVTDPYGRILGFLDQSLNIWTGERVELNYINVNTCKVLLATLNGKAIL
jgi:hypothetical protein